jgi:hypothetical protein
MSRFGMGQQMTGNFLTNENFHWITDLIFICEVSIAVHWQFESSDTHIYV